MGSSAVDYVWLRPSSYLIKCFIEKARLVLREREIDAFLTTKNTD